MRKKYLSALLFGALLMTSAGTFTSCKDYDDEINDLQEQINTVKTSLDELSEKLNNLGAGVTDFKYEGGKLILSTDKGTNFEVTLPEDKVGITKVEVKDGYLWIDGVKGDAIVTEGGEAIDVRVDENGILYINDVPQDLKDEVGSNVIVVDNGDGTYTLTVDESSYILPKASASVNVLITENENDYDGYYYFTNLDYPNPNFGGIYWGKADKYKGNWKGLKTVSKGQFLIGQINTVDVKVTPATFDLATTKLTLVNTLGEVAPVKVTPITVGKEGPAISGSRAADANGEWELSIEMDNTINAENIATAFAAKDASDNYKYKNVRYALAVDGNVVTDYKIIVDTQEEAETSPISSLSLIKAEFKNKGIVNTLINRLDKSEVNCKLPLGETTISLNTISVLNDDASKIYDAYIELTDQDKADAYGVEVEGMTIKASHSAGSLTDLPFKIHILDITGNEVVTDEFNVSFEASTESGVVIAPQTYTVMPTSTDEGAFVLVDLGETFTSLTAEDAHKISNREDDAVNWYTTTDARTFDVFGSAIEGGIARIKNSSRIMYYASKEDALKDALSGMALDKEGNPLAIKVAGGVASTIKTIKFAAIPVSSFKNDANIGTNNITIILEGEKDSRVNEIKRATTELTIALPTFDDVLEANASQNLWNEAKDTYTTRINGNSEISLVKPFISKKDANGVAFYDLNKADGSLKYELKYTDAAEKVQLIDITNANPKVLTGKLVTDNHELIHSIDVTSTLYPFGVSYKNLKVNKTFKIYMQSIFEGATLAYYNGGVKQETISLEEYKYISAGSKPNNKNQGLFISFDGEEHAYSFKAGVNSFTNGIEILGSIVNTDKPNNMASPNSDKAISPYIYLGEGATGELRPNAEGDALELVDVAGGTSGTIIFNFVDKMGVYVPVTISYKK